MELNYFGPIGLTKQVLPSMIERRTGQIVVVSSLLRAFPDEFAEHVEGRCRHQRSELGVPKIVDLADGVVTYDEKQLRKNPDWTYF